MCDVFVPHEAGVPVGLQSEVSYSRERGSNSVVESQPSKLLVAGSIPVSRSKLLAKKGSKRQMEQVGQSGMESVDRTRALYERPALGVEDETTFLVVKRAVEARLSEAGISDFLRSLEKKNLRIRDFAGVLAAGKLGTEAGAQYGRLSPSDQGQIRELYLASLEQIAMPLRDRFFKLYAYY